MQKEWHKTRLSQAGEGVKRVSFTRHHASGGHGPPVNAICKFERRALCRVGKEMEPPVEDWFGFVEGSEKVAGEDLKRLVASDPRVQALTNYFSRLALSELPQVNHLFWCSLLPSGFCTVYLDIEFPDSSRVSFMLPESLDFTFNIMLLPVYFILYLLLFEHQQPLLLSGCRGFKSGR